LQYLSCKIGKRRKKGIDEAQNKVALGLNALCSPKGPEKIASHSYDG
jgi:hypothetical protein